MKVSSQNPALAEQLIRQQNPSSNQRNQAREIIEKSQQARTQSNGVQLRDELALYKRPRPDLTIPPLNNQSSLSTMTRRFESLYDTQVEKGRNVDVKV